MHKRIYKIEFLPFIILSSSSFCHYLMCVCVECETHDLHVEIFIIIILFFFVCTGQKNKLKINMKQFFF